MDNYSTYHVDNNIHILINKSYADKKEQDAEVAVNIIQILIGLSLALANGVFLIFIFLNRMNLQWKRYGLVLSHSVADFFLGLTLVVVACIWVPLLSSVNTLVVIIMEALKFCSLTIMIFSYSGLMIIQYLAFKKPLLYRLKLSKTYIFICALIIWVFSPSYVILKSYLIVLDTIHMKRYAIAEISVATSCGSIIIICYLYVLHVASDQRRCWRQNGNAVPLVYLRGKTERRRRRSSNSIANYKFLTITGLRLIYFIMSLLPICIYALVRIITADEYSYSQISFAYCTTGRHYVLMIWFSRGLIDPIIHLILDSKLIRCEGSGFQSVSNSA